MAAFSETRKLLDGLGMTASAICSVHCILLPLVIGFVPALASSWLGSEIFHLVMLAAILPNALLAMWMTRRARRDRSVVGLIVAGLALLLAGLAAEPMFDDSIASHLVTVAGSGLLAAGHWRNFRLAARCRTSHELARGGR